MNFISQLQCGLLPPFSTKQMEVKVHAQDLPARKQRQQNWTWVSLTAGLPAIHCRAQLPGSHFSWSDGKGSCQTQGGSKSLPDRCFQFSRHSCMSPPRRPYWRAPRPRAGRWVFRSSAQASILAREVSSQPRSVPPEPPPFSPSPLLQVPRFPATFRFDILNVSKGYSHWHWACRCVELSNKRGKLTGIYILKWVMRGQRFPNICFQHFQGGLQSAGSTEPRGYEQLLVTSHSAASRSWEWMVGPSHCTHVLCGSIQAVCPLRFRVPALLVGFYTPVWKPWVWISPSVRVLETEDSKKKSLCQGTGRNAF